MRRENRCGDCRWWDRKERTAAIEWTEAECRKRAPFPMPVVSRAPLRQFPVTRGMDVCGDFQWAGPEVYRADYREELGPWISLDVILGGRTPSNPQRGDV